MQVGTQLILGSRLNTYGVIIDEINIPFPRYYGLTKREPGVTEEIIILRIDESPDSSESFVWSSKTGRHGIDPRTERDHEMLLIHGWVHVSEQTIKKNFVTDF